MLEIYWSGDFLKTPDGNLHQVIIKGPYALDCHSTTDVSSSVNEGRITRPLGYGVAMDAFGVESSVIKNHPSGRITEDSLLRLM
jgi:hypothetical protein